MDEAARNGFANGAFEELDEDVPAVVEEFFPDAGVQALEISSRPTAKADLKDRLTHKVAHLG